MPAKSVTLFHVWGRFPSKHEEQTHLNSGQCWEKNHFGTHRFRFSHVYSYEIANCRGYGGQQIILSETDKYENEH